MRHEPAAGQALAYFGAKTKAIWSPFTIQSVKSETKRPTPHLKHQRDQLALQVSTKSSRRRFGFILQRALKTRISELGLERENNISGDCFMLIGRHVFCR